MLTPRKRKKHTGVFMKLKKIAAVSAWFLLGLSLVQAQSVEFSSELSSDIVSVRKGKAYHFSEDEDEIDDGTTKDFAGIKENFVATFTSERVDAELDVSFILDDYNERNFGLAWDEINWFVEFRPVEIFALGIHEDVYAQGSYLPVYDDNVAAGNLGSSGITAMLKPVEGLVLAATVPFGIFEDDDDSGVNYIDGKKSDDGDLDFNFGFGAEYSFGELFSVGASVGDVLNGDGRTFGIFASVNPIEDAGLTISAGFSYCKTGEAGFDDLSLSEDFGVTGEKLLNFAVAYETDSLSLAGEILFNLDDEDSGYDFYAAAKGEYTFQSNFGVSLLAMLFTDNSSGGYENCYGVNPGVFFQTENHRFEAGVKFETIDGDTFFSFPVSWKYSF